LSIIQTLNVFRLGGEKKIIPR